jgi:hypothetical protein
MNEQCDDINNTAIGHNGGCSARNHAHAIIVRVMKKIGVASGVPGVNYGDTPRSLPSVRADT